jgi:hypothetical protein
MSWLDFFFVMTAALADARYHRLHAHASQACREPDFFGDLSGLSRI